MTKILSASTLGALVLSGVATLPEKAREARKRWSHRQEIAQSKTDKIGFLSIGNAHSIPFASARSPAGFSGAIGTMRQLKLIAAVGLLAGCAATPDQGQSFRGGTQQAVAAFESRLEACTAIHDYSRDNPAGLHPDQRAAAERNWDDCAYHGLWSTVALATTQPRLYDAIIAKRRTMIDTADSGPVTRSEKHAHMLELYEELRRREVAILTTRREQGRVHQGTIDLIRHRSFDVSH